MAGLVVTIAQCKGGAGKTTLAAQLAVSWRAAARRSTSSTSIRRAALPPGSICERYSSAERRSVSTLLRYPLARGAMVEDRPRETDVVVIDRPPHAETEGCGRRRWC
jgi:chromosome partitioning protein